MLKQKSTLGERIPQPNRQPSSGDLIDVLIDPGDQTDDLTCMVTRLEVKIEIRSPFWLRPKYLVVN